MARKKQEVQLLREIETQEEWEEIMSKEGLYVVDVYQEWCGPCDAMVGNFRRIKNELGDNLLHFAMAKADTVESLEKYRGSCEPCFLFFAGGALVSYVHGANAPLILRTLTEQLAQEHKVLEGTVERKEVKDPFVASREVDVGEEEEQEEGEGYIPHRRISTMPQDQEEGRGKFEFNDEVVYYDDELAPAKDDVIQVEEGFTVAIIKPNVLAAGKEDEVIAEMQAKGIQILAQDERQLTEEEAREFYSHLEGAEYFEDLVKFMSSGPSHMLVLTKGQADDSIIKDWRDMLGPPAVEEAKETAPDSMRARFGDAGLINALHGSDSKETAARELAFFFPQMPAPTIQTKKKPVERTLAIIRPDAFATQKDEILQKIQEAGFQIAMQKVVTLSKEQAEEFYKEHQHQEYFETLITHMSSGPMLALGLARDEAIGQWRDTLGPANIEEAKTNAPDSLRAQFALDENPLNQLHGSDSVEAAKREIDFFFPVEQTVALIKPDAIGTKDAIINKIHEAGFRIAAQKETTITRDVAEAFYEDQKDKQYFNDLVEHMISGPTMFMVLSREDAVEGWRQTIGPTDPEKAKMEAPDSIRAQFGIDIKQNAVHGCSTKENAQKKIETVFGHLEFNPDGTPKAPIEPIQEEEREEAVVKRSASDAAEVAPEYQNQAGQQKQEEQQQAEQQQPEQQQEQQQEQAQEEQKQEEAQPEEQKQEEAQPEEQKQEEQQPEQQQEEQKQEEQQQEEQKQEEPTKEEPAKEEEAKEEEAKTEPAKEEEAKTEPAKEEAAAEGEGKAAEAESKQEPGKQTEQKDEKEQKVDKAEKEQKVDKDEKEQKVDKDEKEQQKVDKDEKEQKVDKDEKEQKAEGTDKPEAEQKPDMEKEKSDAGVNPEAESSHSGLDLSEGESDTEEDDEAETAKMEELAEGDETVTQEEETEGEEENASQTAEEGELMEEQTEDADKVTERAGEGQAAEEKKASPSPEPAATEQKTEEPAAQEQKEDTPAAAEEPKTEQAEAKPDESSEQKAQS